ncbi:hypothetical protein F5Y17DRAFT_283240 [Xylariaceae sp. FL0594]|nr:hypothetical protein F5Y17DRAFT_283240 [Xylariaceae sp. FL0594]
MAPTTALLVIDMHVLLDSMTRDALRTSRELISETWLVSDSCATTTKSRHEAALKGFGYGYGPVVTTEAVLEALGM